MTVRASPNVLPVRRAFYTLVVFACYIGIAMLGSLLADSLRLPSSRPRFTNVEWTLFAVATIVSAHIVLLVHELGHVIGGWLAGQRLIELTVGLLTCVREDGRFRIRLNRSIGNYGGQVRMTAATEDQARSAMQLAGGPAASILAGGLVAGAGMLWFSSPAVRTSGVTAHIVATQVTVLGAGSIIVGLANLIPVSFRNRLSDGARLLELMRSEG